MAAEPFPNQDGLQRCAVRITPQLFNTAEKLQARININAGEKPTLSLTPSGVTGAQTINVLAGRVNFAASATTLRVTNNLVTTSSLVFSEIQTADTSAMKDRTVTGDGFFDIHMSVAPSAETAVAFFVLNP